MNYTETDDIWRLYRREWVTVHTTATIQAVDGRTSFETARTWIADNLAGRVHDNDARITLNTDGTNMFWAHVQVYKDNLKGEFKHFATASQHANGNGYDEYTIVPRNSKTDHDIRSYGVKKL